MSDLAGKKIVLLGGTGSLGNAITELITKGFRHIDRFLRVTHQEIARFCISVKQAVHFVLDLLLNTEAEDISYPEMDVFKVIDLARTIAPECEIEIIGLRPGDKVHEELGGRSSEEFVKIEAV